MAERVFTVTESDLRGMKEGDAFRLYVIKRGDTMYALSKEAGVSVDTLARINGIKDPRTSCRAICCYFPFAAERGGQKKRNRGRRVRASGARGFVCRRRLRRSCRGRLLPAPGGTRKPGGRKSAPGFPRRAAVPFCANAQLGSTSISLYRFSVL